MTLSTLTTRIDYAGDGVTTVFPVPYQFFGADELEVIERGAGGAEAVKVRGTHYTVAGGNGATGTVTALMAPPVGLTWVIRRATLRTQPLILTPDGALPAKSLEARFDRHIAIVQEQDEILDRTLQFPPSDTSPVVLPSAADRASRLLGFDPSGAPDMYTPPAISGLAEVLPDGSATPIAADWAIRKIMEVDVAAFGADPAATAAQNDAAFALAVARANSIGGVLKTALRPGLYDLTANIPALTSAAGLDMEGSIFQCTNAAQTGAFLAIGRTVQGGDIGKVLRGIRVRRQTIPDWSDATQIGVLLRTLRCADGEIQEIANFTTGLRCQGEYDGGLAVDEVHNILRIGQILNCRYAVDMYSLSPGTAGAPNSNTFIGGNIVCDTGVNPNTDRYGWCFRRSPWWQGAISVNTTTDEITLTGGTVPANGRIEFFTTNTLPAPLVTGFAYWVVSSVGSVVKVSTTQGGAAVNITDIGTGTHTGISEGYFNHNHNVWLTPAFQHARVGGTGVAYCILSETRPTQNNVLRARAEWGAAVMRGSLTTGGGGPNRIEVDYATSYLRDGLTDDFGAGATHGAWRTVNNRYSQTAIEAMRPLLVVRDLRAQMFLDPRDRGGSSDFSYGFDDLHVTYTTTPPGGVGVATIATCVLRNDQRGAFSASQGIIPNADSISIGSARGIGCIVDTHECKWLVPMIFQKAGARSYRLSFRLFDAAGVLLGSDTPIYVDMPSLTIAWNATSLCWGVGNNSTDANQATRVGYRVPEAVKFVQVCMIYPGSADIADVQGFAVYTPEPYQARAWHGVAGGTRELIGSDTVDPPSLAAGALDSTVRTLTVTGAGPGDMVEMGFTTPGIVPVMAEVSANDTARYRLQNVTSGTLDGALGTVWARVLKHRVP